MSSDIVENSVKTKPKLIIDTNAFIKSLDLNKLAQIYDIYTSDMVLYEIKDKQAKEKFSHLLFEIKTKIPSKTSLSFGIIILFVLFCKLLYKS